MLSKEICKRCCNTNSSDQWSDTDEYHWGENYVYCPDLFRRMNAPALDIESEPPVVCPFLFEQSVATGRSQSVE